MGLWYPKDSGFELTAFLDADHAGCLDTRKSTSGGIQFLDDKLAQRRSGVHTGRLVDPETSTSCLSSEESTLTGLNSSSGHVDTLLRFRLLQGILPRVSSSSPWLQISQNPRGIFINQSKYANEILKKFDLHKSDPVDTPMVERTKLDEDLSGTPVDQTKYRSMMGPPDVPHSQRPDLGFAGCMCADINLGPLKSTLRQVKVGSSVSSTEHR
ncbi:hypothetical protein Tco_1244040 [Tanacetum coccineum]